MAKDVLVEDNGERALLSLFDRILERNPFEFSSGGFAGVFPVHRTAKERLEAMRIKIKSVVRPSSFEEDIRKTAADIVETLNEQERVRQVTALYQSDEKKLYYVQDGIGSMVHTYNENGSSMLIFRFVVDYKTQKKLESGYSGYVPTGKKISTLTLRHLEAVGDELVYKYEETSLGALHVGYGICGYIEVGIRGYRKEQDPEAVALIRKTVSEVYRITSQTDLEKLR